VEEIKERRVRDGMGASGMRERGGCGERGPPALAAEDVEAGGRLVGRGERF